MTIVGAIDLTSPDVDTLASWLIAAGVDPGDAARLARDARHSPSPGRARGLPRAIELSWHTKSDRRVFQIRWARIHQ